MSTPAFPLAECWLELPDGRHFWLRGRCTIGRQPDNELVLGGNSVSRHHALIATENNGSILTDLQSSNGSYVNRAPISRPTPLRDGDELCFGDVILRYRCTRPQQPAKPATSFLDRTQRLDDVRERACWLLLADIAGFTALNARIGSKLALQHFHAWIAAMRPLLENHGAHINSYVGDAIFAWWPATTPTTAAAVRQTLAAIQSWRDQSPLEFRLVLHYGAVLVTRSDRGEELTGQDVNLLFRSEKIAKSLGASAMLSEAAVHSLGLDGRCAPLGAAPVDGMPGRFVFFQPPATL